LIYYRFSSYFLSLYLPFICSFSFDLSFSIPPLCLHSFFLSPLSYLHLPCILTLFIIFSLYLFTSHKITAKYLSELQSYVRTYRTAEVTPWSPSREANSHSATQKFPAFNGTRSFVTVFTRARHWSLFRVKLIQYNIQKNLAKLTSYHVAQTPMSRDQLETQDRSLATAVSETELCRLNKSLLLVQSRLDH
jgi:hypothetical protein